MKTGTICCLHCHQSSDKPLNEIKRGNAKFCNLKCSGLYKEHIKRQALEDVLEKILGKDDDIIASLHEKDENTQAALWVTLNISLKDTGYKVHRCDQCSKFFRRKTYQFKGKHNIHLCSTECQKAAQRIDGIQKIHPPHFGTGTSDYRKFAFANLPKKCAKCNYSLHLEVLEVHHKDENRSNNSLNNLEILCPTCHKVHHFLMKSGPWSQ